MMLAVILLNFYKSTYMIIVMELYWLLSCFLSLFFGHLY